MWGGGDVDEAFNTHNLVHRMAWEKKYGRHVKWQHHSVVHFKTRKMSWDAVEVGLAGGEETVNFGPRNESGSTLYQVDTLASVSPSGTVSYCRFRY